MTEELKFTLEVAHKNLNKFSESSVGKTIEKMLFEIDEMIEAQKFSSAWAYIEQTIRVCDNFGVCAEMAEARVECACDIYKLGYLERAAEYLNQAVERYCPDQHGVAISLWILGCIYWQIPGERDNAINVWRRSRSIIRSLLADDYFMASEKKKWYEERYEEMGIDLEKMTFQSEKPADTGKRKGADAQDAEQASSTADSDAAGDETRPSGNSVWPTNENPKVNRATPILKKAFLRWWPVLSEIPAGIPIGLLLDNPEGSSTLQIHQFQIDEFIYQVHDIHGDSISIAIDLRINYFVLRVTGDSMNKAGINDGDYVLLRSGDAADSNDIVAVEIHDVDAQSTLKRFIVQDNKFIFRPESHNPIHQTHEFREGDDSEKQYLIRGSVVAVLKQIES